MYTSTYAIIIWVTAIFIISLDIVIIIGSKNLSSRAFSVFSFLTGIWVFSQGFFISTTDLWTAINLIKLQYILGITVALGFYHFSHIYPYDHRPSKKLTVLSGFIIFIFTYLYFYTDNLISGAHQIGGIGRWAWDFGKFHFLFDLIFYYLWIIALYKIYKNFSKETGKLRLNLKNMFLALLLGIIPPTLANILLPSLGKYDLNWFGPITSFIWIFIIAYSILKYRQMNVRAVMAEVLAIGMTIIFFINIFIDADSNIIIRVLIFIIFVALAIYLIYVSLRESRQQELLRILNATLSERVAEQTLEVKKAYEIEKKAHRDLVKLNETKDQFIMITQHNLRIPVSNIRLGLESTLSDPTIVISEKQRDAMESAYASATRLSSVVDDFLNITALRTSSQILNITSGNIRTLLDDVIDELRLDIESMHISIKFNNTDELWPDMKIDVNKIREVLLIIIENAIKYNFENGHINIHFNVESGTMKLTIENTGVGIASEEKASLFSKLFYRGKKAQAKNPIGMGVGLSVARAIARAHHGDLTIDSKGENLGAVVLLTLPIDFLSSLNTDII